VTDKSYAQDGAIIGIAHDLFRKPVPTFRDHALFHGQFLLDRRDQARIVGFHGGGEGRLQAAVAADQIFMEIPARGFQRALLRRPFVERVGVLALDRGLFGERKGNMVVALGGFSISLTPPGS
jgi:hypothetical protein